MHQELTLRNDALPRLPRLRLALRRPRPATRVNLVAKGERAVLTEWPQGRLAHWRPRF